MWFFRLHLLQRISLQAPLWWNLHWLHFGRFPAYGLLAAGVIGVVVAWTATTRCSLENPWVCCPFLLPPDLSFLLLSLGFGVPWQVVTCWFPCLFLWLELSMLFLPPLGLFALICAIAAVTAAITAAWNVAESICRSGVLRVRLLFLRDGIFLMHIDNPDRKWWSAFLVVLYKFSHLVVKFLLPPSTSLWCIYCSR